jgi:ribosome-associated protein
MNEVDEDGFAVRPNKTQLKQNLAETGLLVLQLIDLAEKEQLELKLTDQAMAELKQAKGMKADNARKRLLKHIAKLLSREDVDLIKDYFARQDAQQQQLNHAFHQLESMRDRMIEDGDPALQEFLDEHATADRQQLRQALRNARKERDTGKPAGAGKKLFRLLREELKGFQARNA